jgi:hypothetical protein
MLCNIRTNTTNVKSLKMKCNFNLSRRAAKRVCRDESSPMMYPTSKAQQDRPELTGKCPSKHYLRASADTVQKKSTENDGFLDALAKLPTKAPGTIRLFERAGDNGGFYSAHGDDALFVAQNFYNTNSVLKYFGGRGRPLPSCTLSRVNAIAFLREALTARQLKIEIWSSSGKKSYDWKLSKQVCVRYFNPPFLSFPSGKKGGKRKA